MVLTFHVASLIVGWLCPFFYYYFFVILFLFLWFGVEIYNFLLVLVYDSHTQRSKQVVVG